MNSNCKYHSLLLFILAIHTVSKQLHRNAIEHRKHIYHEITFWDLWSVLRDFCMTLNSYSARG